MLVLDTITVGRDLTSNIKFSDKKVSRKHLTLTLEDGSCFLTDTSSHGTFANNQKLEKRTKTKLDPDSTVHVGGIGETKFHLKKTKEFFVFSGVPTSRKASMVAFVKEKLGSEISSQVSSKTNHLITGGIVKITLKLLYALIYNCSVVRIEWLEKLMQLNGEEIPKIEEYKPTFAQEVVPSQHRQSLFQGRTLFFSKTDFNRYSEVVKACHGNPVILDPGKSLQDTLERIQNFALFTLSNPANQTEAQTLKLQTQDTRTVFRMIIQAKADLDEVTWYDRLPGAEKEPVAPLPKPKPDPVNPKPVHFVKKSQAEPHSQSQSQSCQPKKKSKPVFGKRPHFGKKRKRDSQQSHPGPLAKKPKRGGVIHVGNMASQVFPSQPEVSESPSPQAGIGADAEMAESAILNPPPSVVQDSEPLVVSPRKKLPTGKFVRLRSEESLELQSNEVEMEIIVRRPEPAALGDEDDEKQAEGADGGGVPNFKKFKKKTHSK